MLNQAGWHGQPDLLQRLSAQPVNLGQYVRMEFFVRQEGFTQAGFQLCAHRAKRGAVCYGFLLVHLAQVIVKLIVFRKIHVFMIA